MISLENYKDNPELVIGNLLFKLNERVFLKTELNVVYSDLVNWERSNLLNIGGNSDKGDWKRLNYFEYIWVKIIQELRAFGFSYEEIDNYKSELMIKPNIKEIIEAIKIDFQSVEEQFDAITLNNLKSIEDNGSNEKIDLGISYFELMISRIIGSGEKWSILFFKDIPGFYFPLSIETLKGFDKIGKTDIPEELLSKTYLSISLTDIIANFLVDGKNAFEKKTISILTKNEHNLLKHIRKGYGKIKSIKIRFKDKEMELLEVTSIKKVKMEGRLLDYIKKGEYQSISIDTVDGKIVNFENTQKIKF
ncbi:hypothetical protein FBBAL38_11799 [Flavobacteria bacterium BAL38]|nr:hypothetical protein FBBAL38_11799 [Flavobacteria bacterium BAL38]